MIDWSKYPKLSALDSTYFLEFSRLLRDVRRAERERCARHLRRLHAPASKWHAGAQHCAVAIEALRDE